MSYYDICIEAAGVPVLAYHEDGQYGGTWFAYTAAGFYTGNYGSCGGCDWRESEMDKLSSSKTTAEKIDAAIGREILKAPAMTRGQLFAAMTTMYLDDAAAVGTWIQKVAP